MKKVLSIVVAVIIIGATFAIAAPPVFAQVSEEPLTVTKTLYWEYSSGYPTYLPNPDYHFGDNDGIIEVGEKVRFIIKILVTNNSETDTVSDITVKDRLGADLELWTPGGAYPAYWVQVGAGSISHTTNRNGDQVRLTWESFSLPPETYAFIYVCVQTDLDRGGNQRYTSPCEHYLNSGATAKGTYMGHKTSASSDSISVDVFWDLEGDWEGTSQQTSPTSEPVEEFYMSITSQVQEDGYCSLDGTASSQSLDYYGPPIHIDNTVSTTHCDDVYIKLIGSAYYRYLSGTVSEDGEMIVGTWTDTEGKSGVFSLTRD